MVESDDCVEDWFFPLAATDTPRKTTLRQSAPGESDRMYQHNMDGYAVMTEHSDVEKAKETNELIVAHPDVLVEVRQ